MSDPVRSDAPRFDGIDWGRAVFAVLVVAWHTRVLGGSRLFDPEWRRLGEPWDWRGILYVDVFLLAVPFFIVTSMFLFVRGWEAGTARVWRRLRQLLVLTLFWAAVYTFTAGSRMRAPEAGWLGTLFTANSTVLYFTVELVLLTIAAVVLLRLGIARRTRVLWAALAASLVLLCLRVPIAEAAGSPTLQAFWVPLWFLPYLFAALVVHDVVVVRRASFRGRVALALLAAFVVAAVLEWLLMPLAANVGVDGTTMPPYARPSTVIGAGAILYALATVRLPVPAPVRLLSDLSLPIFVLHGLLLENLAKATFLPAGTVWAFVFVLGGALIASYALKRERVL